MKLETGNVTDKVGCDTYFILLRIILKTHLKGEVHPPLLLRLNKDNNYII